MLQLSLYTSPYRRPYRKGLSREAAIEEIRRNIGVQFNPKPARAIIELYEHRLL